MVECHICHERVRWWQLATYTVIVISGAKIWDVEWWDCHWKCKTWRRKRQCAEG